MNINNTFNCFLKYLNTFELFISVAKWFDSARNSKFGIRTGVSEQNFERFITMSLFKIFIKNEVNLHTLEIKAAIIYYRELNEILELILQNQNFIHNIGNLKVNYIRGDNDNTIINNHISQIIHLHQNLKKILIYGNFLSLCQLLLSKDYYCEISTYQKINLIKNIKQSLNYLIIKICPVEDCSTCSSIILKNLGQILPSKLDYISLDFTIKESDFRVFLENSQYIFINKLLIKLKSGIDDILHYIKEYIMKEKRVKYLAIKNIKNGELFDLKDEVREFKLHNIIVRRYSDLVIDFDDNDDYIWNIDKL
ncbi:unnamed protein product [Rhizophagus irregularis]|nr:unnamed protein product [Rhizophagus irregularis]